MGSGVSKATPKDSSADHTAPQCDDPSGAVATKPANAQRTNLLDFLSKPLSFLHVQKPNANEPDDSEKKRRRSADDNEGDEAGGVGSSQREGLVTRLTIIKAEGLLAKDLGGTSDPFAEILLGGRLVHTTKIIPKSLCPEWNENVTLYHAGLSPKMEVVDIVLFDHDKGVLKNSKEYLGSISFSLSRPPGSRCVVRWFSLESNPKFANTAESITGRVLVEMETHLLASFAAGEEFPWEQDDADTAVPEIALQEVFWWHKGDVHVTVVSGAHMPKMDTFGLCDPFATIALDGVKLRTKHVRKTLNPVWNECFVLHVADGEEVAKRYYKKLRKDSASAAAELVTLKLELMDWDLTGNERIGFVTIELYALLDKIARAGSGSGIEATFPVLETTDSDSAPIKGFDGSDTELTLRFRWELDEVAEMARREAVEAAENEKRRKAQAVMLEEERRLREKVEEEKRARRAVLREQFLQQLVVDAEKGGDVYSCGAGAYGQHGQGHSNDSLREPRLVEGAERGVNQKVVAGDAHSFFVSETVEVGNMSSRLGCGVMACGSGAFGQLGLIECRAPKAGNAFDAPELNSAMVVQEQLVPNVVEALADGQGLSYGQVHWTLEDEDVDGGTDKDTVKTLVSASQSRQEHEVCEEGGEEMDAELGSSAFAEQMLVRKEQQQSLPPSLNGGRLGGFHVRVAQISAGARHSILVSCSGRAFSCGEWAAGALGLGLPPSAPPAPLTNSQLVFREMVGLPDGKRVVMAGAGGFHSALVLACGDVWSVGTGNVGQLGYWLRDGDIGWNVRKVEGIPRIRKVDAGALHMLLVGEEGDVWSCGSGKHGRLGLGNERDTAPPAKIGGCEKYVSVSTGRMHSLLLTETGRVLACGNNKFGQLGLAREVFDMAYLRYFTGGGDYIGEGHHRDGEVGRRIPELTFPGNVVVPVPVWLPPSLTIVEVAAGGLHSVFLTDEGDVWVTGCNYNGQLGLTEDPGWEDPTPPPSPLPALKGQFEVHITSARNLPKMDTFLGSCDAFCEVKFQGQAFVSSVQKETYSPDWGEAFDFNFCFEDEKAEDLGKGQGGSNDSKHSPILKRHATTLGSQIIGSVEEMTGLDLDGDDVIGKTTSILEIIVRDWDRFSFGDEVGRIMIKSNDMEKMIGDQIHAANAIARKKRKTSDNASRHDAGDDDFVGKTFEGKVSVSGLMADRQVDAAPQEISLELLNKDGKPVIGQNGQISVLTFSVRLLCLGEPPELPAPRALKVTVSCARNLPKMDLFGTCDPFFTVAWQGQMFKSPVCHQNLNPDWSDSYSFEFPWRQIAEGRGGDLEIAIMDWDRLSLADEVGRVVVGQSTLKQLVLQQDFEHEAAVHDKSMQTQDHEKGNSAPPSNVGGDDGNASAAGGAICTPATMREDEEEDQQSEAQIMEEEARRKSSAGVLELTINWAQHLPKMDLFGSIDPFCEVHWLAYKEKTSVMKSTYSPEWHESFRFPYDLPPDGTDTSELANTHLKIVVKDWDRLGEAEEVGHCVLPAGLLAVASRHKLKPVSLSPVGHASTSLQVLDGAGNPVKGHDSLHAVLDVSIRLLDPLPPAQEAQVRVSILRARNLMAMDRSGTSDPYAVLTLSSRPAKKKQTRVVFKELSPVWNAKFDFSSENFWDDNLEVSVFDKDLLSDDRIGKVSISLADLGCAPPIRQHQQNLGGKEARWYTINDDKKKAAGEVQLSIELLRPPPSAAAQTFVVTVAVQRGRGLLAKDSNGTSDPYLVLQYEKQRHKTKVVSKNLNPVWEEKLLLLVNTLDFRPSEPVMLSVWDKDIIGKDDLIGDTSLDLEHILRQIIPAANASSSEPAAVPAGNATKRKRRILNQARNPSSRTHSAWHTIYEDAAQTKRAGEVLLCISATERLQFHPELEKDISISSKRAAQRLGQGGFFELRDPANGSSIMGKAVSASETLFESKLPSVIYIQVQLLPKEQNPAQQTEEEEATAQVSPQTPQEMKLHIHVIEAKSLKAMDRNGKSDPYVTIQVGKLGKAKTDKSRKCQSRVIKKNLNPAWDEHFELVALINEVETEVLSVQVWDKDLFGTDDAIGEFVYPLASITRTSNVAHRSMAPPVGSVQWHTVADKTGVATGRLCLRLYFVHPDSNAADALSPALFPLEDLQELDESADGTLEDPFNVVNRVVGAAPMLSPVTDTGNDSRDVAHASQSKQGDLLAGEEGNKGRSSLDAMLSDIFKRKPVAKVPKIGQDERLPRIISAMTGIKVVAVAAGGAHTLLLTSKLARRQRLIARIVLGRVRLQSLTRTFGMWRKGTRSCADSESEASDSDFSDLSGSGDVVSMLTVVRAENLPDMDSRTSLKPCVEVRLTDAIEGRKTFQSSSLIRFSDQGTGSDADGQSSE